MDLGIGKFREDLVGAGRSSWVMLGKSRKPMWKGIAFLTSWAEYRKSLQRLPKNKQHRFILDDRACIFTVDLSARQCHRFRYTINRSVW